MASLRSKFGTRADVVYRRDSHVEIWLHAVAVWWCRRALEGDTSREMSLGFKLLVVLDGGGGERRVFDDDVDGDPIWLGVRGVEDAG